MAKSSYIDNLINGATPDQYKSRYLTELWNNGSVNNYDTYKYSITNNFSNEIAIAVAGSEYLNNLNNNQTVLDMQNPYLSSVTLNPQYLPTINTNMRNTYADSKTGELIPYVSSITAPPDYLTARITPVKNGKGGTPIPILFPLSFSRSISASFAKENPVGSTTPIMAYSFTDAEEIPLEFDALADYLPTGYTSLKQYVDAVFNLLKPGVANNVIYEPTVIVEFADMSFKGVCTSVSVSYDNLYNYKSFAHAKINCSFTKLSN